MTRIPYKLNVYNDTLSLMQSPVQYIVDVMDFHALTPVLQSFYNMLIELKLGFQKIHSY